MSVINDMSKKGILSSKLFWILVAVALFLLLQIPLTNYLVDDAYIHLTFARNIATGNGFSFNPREPTYGVTAPLWTLLMAPLSLLFGAQPFIAKIVSTVFGALTIPLIFRLGRRFGLQATSVIGVTLAWGVNLWLVRWSASGMETSLAILLLMLAFNDQLQGRSTAGIWLGFSVLTRPETIIIAVIFALDRWRIQGLKKALETVSLFLLASLPWQLYAWVTFGTVTPNPAQVKSGGFFPHLPDLLLGFKRAVGVLLASSSWEVIVIAAAVFLLWHKSKKIVDEKEHETLIPVSLPNEDSVVSARKLALLIVWAVFPPVVFLSREVFIQSRYLIIAIPAVLIGGFLAFDTLERQGRRLFNKSTRFVLIGLIMCQNLLLSVILTYPHARLFQETTDALTELSTYLREHTPAGSSVAVGDVGLIGFYSHRYVIDVEGLVTQQMIPIRALMTQEDLIASEIYWSIKRPDYVIDISTMPDRLCTLPEVGSHYREVIRIPITGALIGGNRDIRYYTLYKVVMENTSKEIQ